MGEFLDAVSEAAAAFDDALEGFFQDAEFFDGGLAFLGGQQADGFVELGEFLAQSWQIPQL